MKTLKMEFKIKREYLFRGIEVDGQGNRLGWIYWNCFGQIINLETGLFTGELTTQKLINLNTVGEFTGQFDKNKKRIFEGDIVKVYEFHFTSSGELPDIFEVKFYDCQFDLWKGNRSFHGLHLGYIKDGEILGNNCESNLNDYSQRIHCC